MSELGDGRGDEEGRERAWEMGDGRFAQGFEAEV